MKAVCPLRLAAVALAVNAEAVPTDKDKDKPPVVEVPKDKDKDKYNGPVASVPDNGNTVLLLGTAILVLGIASRRFAIHSAILKQHE